MRLNANVVLLNVCLLASVLGLRIPDLPGLPKLPDAPTTPDVPNTPGQPDYEPGRMPQEGQNPNAAPLEPGRMPETPPPSIPDTPSCWGKKRMDCGSWDDASIETKFREPGQQALYRLDRLKIEPPPPYNGPTIDTLNARYATRQVQEPLGGDEIPVIMEKMDTTGTWSKFEVRNSDQTINRWYQTEIQKAQTIERMDQLDIMTQDLKSENRILKQYTSPDGKTLIFDKFCNAKYDLYRKLENEPENGFREYERDEMDKDAVIRFTDQAMIGWKQSVGNRNPRDIGLEKIIHKGIITEDTHTVINAVLKRKGVTLVNDGQIIEFTKGGAIFDALLGTVHGKRTADMLFDHHEMLGDRTISKISIGFDDADDYDMFIQVEQIV